MKQKMFSAISGILILAAVALPASSFADDDDRKHRNDPEHSITEAHEGVEGGELFAAGAGLVIALGLAYAIGRRTGKKR
jgi:hypothetical protein